MRRLILWNIISLDGFYEGPGHDISWLAASWGEELEAFSIEQGDDAGTLLFGRMTYELMVNHWPSAEGAVADFMNALPKVVASKTLKKADWNNTRVINDDIPGEVEKLKRESGKNIYIFGSGKLAATLAQHGLIDEVRIGVNPLILGGGTSLFTGWPKNMNLQLIECRPLKCGVVILKYGRQDKAA